jgi:co-chaperonin GroES (HSP10)
MRRLLNNYILIKVDPTPEKNSSGLLINPDQIKIPQTGTVVAVAPGVKDLKKGDRVHFLRYASIDALEEDERLCKPEHIIEVL